MKTLGHPPYTCLITAGSSNPENFETEKARMLDVMRDAIVDGVSMIQIREKQLSLRALFDLTRDAVDLAMNTSTLIVVNDRADIAAAARADGVHLPESSFDPDVIRTAFGERLLIGVSTHSLEHATRMSRSEADYIFFGPVYDTPGKHKKGIESLREVCHAVRPFPVIGLGGIDQSNANDVIAAGAAGVAAIRSLHDTEPRRDILRSLNAKR